MNMLLAIKPGTEVVLDLPDSPPLIYELGTYGFNGGPINSEDVGNNVEIELRLAKVQPNEVPAGTPQALKLRIPNGPAATDSSTVGQLKHLFA